MSAFLGRIDRRQLPVAVLVVLGVLMRVAWNTLRPTSGAAGEAMRVAAAIGSGHGFADAYRIGQGPTAHLMPVSPSIAGLVYMVFGVGSRIAEILLASWSIGLAIGTYLLLYRAFGRLGTPRWARLAGLAFGCLAPAYLNCEAVDFRVWEGGLATFLLALFFDRLLAAESAAVVSGRMILAMAGLTGLLFFVNPPLGIAAYLCAGIFCLRKLPLARTMQAIGASLVVLAILIVPWTLRNMKELGAPIVLRSNAGLELALAQYPGAVNPPSRREAFLARLDQIHPTLSLDAYHRMQAAGGEVPYAKALGAEAKAWMKAHPAESAKLMLLHLRQSLVPQRWQFDVFGRALSPTLRAVLTDIAGLGGLVSLFWALLARRRNWWYPAVIVASWALLTAPFQPVTRYTYLIYPLMVFCAADLLGRLRRAHDRSERTMQA